MILGFDIGGTKVLGLAVDPESGAVLDRAVASSDGDGPQLVATLASMAGDLAAAVELPLTVVGLAVAGLAETGGVLRYSPNLPDIVEYPLGTALSAELGVAVTMGNDATTGALAEWRLGAGRGVDDLVYAALGTGIGAGLVLGGRLMPGAHGFAGEVGHMVMDPNGPEHLTGRRGPWEYYASGTALGRMGREAAKKGDFDDGLDEAASIEAVDSHTVVSRLAVGSEQAAIIFDGFCREVARGLVDLVLILDPARIVLGGGIVEVGEPLRLGVERWVGDLLLGAEHRPPVEVHLAELGVDAGALGAALLAVDKA
jgi:glucokinase